MLVQRPELDINHQDNTGLSAVMYVSFVGATKCVKILAETGRVDWSLAWPLGHTALEIAYRRGHFEICMVIAQYVYI